MDGMESPFRRGRRRVQGVRPAGAFQSGSRESRIPMRLCGTTPMAQTPRYDPETDGAGRKVRTRRQEPEGTPASHALPPVARNPCPVGWTVMRPSRSCEGTPGRGSVQVRRGNETGRAPGTTPTHHRKIVGYLRCAAACWTPCAPRSGDAVPFERWRAGESPAALISST
jgi:hypothetical protein